MAAGGLLFRVAGGYETRSLEADAQIALSHWRDRPAEPRRDYVHRLTWKVVVLAVIASIALVGTALAAHGPVGTSVVDGGPPHQQRGTLAEKIKLNLGNIKVQTKGPVDVVTQEVTFAAGVGSAGWHSHPGAVFVVMRTGTLTVWDENCVMSEYSGPIAPSTTGETFFEAGPHHPMLVKNLGANPATLYVTYIVPVGAGPLRIPQPDRCGMH